MTTYLKSRLGMKTSEADLVCELKTFLMGQGYLVRTEISNMGQSADIVAKKGRWVTCIEAKMTDWKRALGQCRAHEMVADFVCIALDKAILPSELIKIAKLNGYGVISRASKNSSEFDWAVFPKVNRKVWKPQQKRLVADFRMSNEY